MIPTTLTFEARALAEKHYRLAMDLYLEATSAARDGNLHVRDCLIEQADLHTATSAMIDDLVDQMTMFAGTGF